MTIQNDAELRAHMTDLWGRPYEALMVQVGALELSRKHPLRIRITRLQRTRKRLERVLKEAAHGVRSDWDEVHADLEKATEEFMELKTRVESALDARRGKQLQEVEADVRRWSRYADSLLVAFRGSREIPHVMAAKLESLRHKRDSVLTKLHALRRHRRKGWLRAKADFERARAEFQDSWRSVVSTLAQEKLYV